MTDAVRIAIALGLFAMPFVLLPILFLLHRWGRWRWPTRFVHAERGSREAWIMLIASVSTTVIAGIALPRDLFRDPDVRFWSGAVFLVLMIAAIVVLDRYSRRIEGRFLERRKNTPES